MFSIDMLAPCGLNCALCRHVCGNGSPCPGCKAEGENKPEFCATMCRIARCEKRIALPDGYCDRCEDYPCRDVMEKELRYANAYPMIQSPMGNLDFLRREGAEAFLKREAARWTCACGGTICVHTGVCEACGRAYTDRVRGVENGLSSDA